MAIVDTKLGKRVKIYHQELVNLYGCTIGDDCSIGAFVEIRKNVSVGNKVKIQAGVFIPEGVVIEDEVFIGPHVCFTNDMYPRATDKKGNLLKESQCNLLQTLVKKRASIGANVTLLCGITIGEGALIGAGSVVIKDVPAGAVVVGNPARVVKKTENTTK